jgi:outer membrane protein insertion porin family
MQRLTLILLLFILVASGLTAQEDQWYIDKPIAEIQFEGLSSISENELFGLIRPLIGEPYSEELSWNLQSRLYALDYFDIIIPEIRPGPTGRNTVVLVFQVQEKPLVDDVLFTGNSKARRGELLDTVLVKTGDLLNAGTLRLDEQALVDFYLEKGFIDASVESQYEIDEETNSAVIIFRIDEGNQTKISEIRFVGNDKHVSDDTLRKLISTKPQSLFNKGLFVETTLQEDLKAIERYYGDQGFIDASVLNVDKQIVFDEEENLNKMIITVVIEEGEAWQYGGMTFEGNSIYSDEELDEQISQVEGSTFNLTKFQLDYQRVTDLYFENGYIFNNFTYEETRNEATREVSYKVTIVERDRAHIQDIIIRGNTKTKEYVIRREIPLEEGEVFSKSKIFDGMMNLYNLQYFDVVEPTPYPAGEDGLMDLIIDVSEGKTSDIGFGLSFSGGADFPISGQLNWNDRNFLGRGQVIGADLSVSPDVVRTSLRFTEPRILGRRWMGGVDLTYTWAKNRRIAQDWDNDGVPDPYGSQAEYEAAGSIPSDTLMEYRSNYISTGFNTGYTWLTRLGRLGVSTGLRLTWEYVKYDDEVYRPLNPTVRDNLENWKYSDSISLKASWDTRDLQFDPTKGFILSQSLTYSGIIPQSNRHFIKTVSRFNFNQMLFDIPVNDEGRTFRSVFSFNSTFSSIYDKPWREQPGSAVDTDGYSIDGMFVARGWPTSTIRYQHLWDNSLQLKFPIVPNILSFDLFLDGVGAWESTEVLNDMVGDDWRFSLGGGLRFANPQFPIGIYVVKRFQWQNGSLTWFPDVDSNGDRTYDKYEFRDSGMDLVIAFNLDIY